MTKLSKEQIKAVVSKLKAKKRKKTEGKPNIEGVSAPKKKKPSKKKAPKGNKSDKPATIGVGIHGGQYIQEPSDHKRYISHGTAAGHKRIAKSEQVKQILEDIVKKSQINEFIKTYKGKK